MSGAPRRGQGFWLTVGEIVGVLALVITGLNYWESHQQHLEDQKREAHVEAARSAFVATASPDRDGRTLSLAPLSGGQAIQSVRFTFPADLSDSPHEISAARPRIESGWIAPGLRQALAGGPHSGESRAPVLIETTYIEDGDTREDRSIYQVGYAWKSRLFGGQEIRLEGLALARRAVGADAGARLAAMWARERPKTAP